MKSSLEIAQEAELLPIETIAERTGLTPDEFEPYGRYKAKVSLDVIERMADVPDGKIVCVAGVTPTKAGEGKTTTAVGLTQGLGHIGKDPLLCLREPSLGPGVRHQGRRRRRRHDPGRADGGPEPPFHRRHPRDRRGQQPARRASRRLDPARQPAQDRRPADRLAAGAGHERPRPAPGGARAGRAGQRLPARVRLRHHRGLRGDGDPRRGARPARPAGPPRRDHRGALLRRRQARDRGGPGRRRGHDGAAQGRAQAEPDPDARGPALPDARRARSPTSRTATRRWWRT